jgi:arylformamidase
MGVYIDISRRLYPGTAVWPGDSPFTMTQTLSLERGDSVNLTTLTLSAHTGSHVDAPRHFSREGLSIDEVDLRPFWGTAQVVTVDRKDGELLPEDLAGYDLSLAPRLLIHSRASHMDQGGFPQAYVFPGPTLAELLGRLGIILYGTDGPSMDAKHSHELPGHQALWRNGIAILEWLDLSRADDGLYELAALPLRIADGDGSPVRAVLRTLEANREFGLK